MTQTGDSIYAREKVLAAFDPQGSRQIAAVSCYDNLFIRDHWSDLTDAPWWFRNFGVPEREIAWMQDVLCNSGLEWLMFQAPALTVNEAAAYDYRERSDGVWRIDKRNGKEEKLIEPAPGGANTSSAADAHFDLNRLPVSEKEIDAALASPEAFDMEAFRAEGRDRLAVKARECLPAALTGCVSSPLTLLYNHWGFEGLMLMIAERPALVKHAGRRLLEVSRQAVRRMAAMGLDIAFIEELFTDQISPDAFGDLNLPLMRSLVEEIVGCGLKSVYYFAGDPKGKLELIIDSGADGFHFEESKKGFNIDVANVLEAVDGRAAVFGNLDSIAILQNGGDEDLLAEVDRQVFAGKNHKGRFVMSTGSPITPGTPATRVRQYTDLVRRVGK